jgi:hypothetical protein
MGMTVEQQRITIEGLIEKYSRKIEKADAILAEQETRWYSNKPIMRFDLVLEMRRARVEQMRLFLHRARGDRAELGD